MENNTENGFKPIETQDELNAIIKDRLAREREASNKRFEGYISPDEHAKAIASEKKLFEDYKKAHEGDASIEQHLRIAEAHEEHGSCHHADGRL